MGRCCVQRVRSAKRLSLRELFIGNIDGCDFGTEALADLNGNVPQTADAENSKALPSQDFGVFEGAINSYASAEKRGDFIRRKVRSNFHRVARGSLCKFGVSTVHRYAGNRLLDAEIFITASAKFTDSASPVHPWHADAVT